MIASREDYLKAGQNYFPLNWEVREPVKVLLALSLVLYAALIALYFVGGFDWLYLILANLLGILMLFASARPVVSSSSRNAWRLYKLTAFPYLGLIFLVMVLDIWLLK